MAYIRLRPSVNCILIPHPTSYNTQKTSWWGNWPLERPQLALRYFERFSVFLIEVSRALSTSFWSAALEAAMGSLALGLPSSKNSSSAELADFVEGFAKYASLNFSSTWRFNDRLVRIKQSIVCQAYLKTRNINLRGCRDNIGLVHSSQRNAVDLVRASYEQQSAGKLLQEYNAFPSVTSSQQNEDGTRCDWCSEGWGIRGLAAFLGLAHIFSGVEARRFRGGDEALSAVLLTTNGFLDVICGGVGSWLDGFFGALVESSGSEYLRAGETSNAGDKFLASGHSMEGFNDGWEDYMWTYLEFLRSSTPMAIILYSSVLSCGLVTAQYLRYIPVMYW